MHGLQASRFLLPLWALAISAAGYSTEDSSATFNFRPSNVTLGVLYFWVGSYFNGTAHLEFLPYAGLAASETGGCVALRNKTITKEYNTLLALTEPSTYNVGTDPVNAFLTLWPLGFEFGTFATPLEYEVLPSLEWGVYSSSPVYDRDSPMAIESDFVWSLEETEAPPYNLSSILTDYNGDFPQALVNATYDSFQVNASATNCSGTEVSNWQFQPLSFNTTFNGTNFTNPVINLQFDGQTANLTMKGYFRSITQYMPLSVWYQEPASEFFSGEFTLSFSGVIDLYHSDVLRNDTATPTWLRTVGYQNNSLNVGYTSGSVGGQARLWSLDLIMYFVLLQVLLFVC